VTEELLPAWEADSARQPANFRDLGGLPLAGGVTRPGLLYRSDAMYPGDSAPADAPAWPPATVIDLRSPGEAPSFPWPAGVGVHRIPLLRRAAVLTDPSAQGLTLQALYATALRAVPDRLAGLVTLAADAPGPILVHCAAGKDRTGVAVAVLLLVAGAEPATVIGDYTATAARMPVLLRRLEALGRRLPADAEEHPELLGAPESAITLVTDQVAGWPGGPVGWLTDHGGSAADADRWRERLLAR
jgi:protein-tyrosine phosphatase